MRRSESVVRHTVNLAVLLTMPGVSHWNGRSQPISERTSGLGKADEGCLTECSTSKVPKKM